MTEHVSTTKVQPHEPADLAFSNSIRLTVRQWLGLGLFTVLFVALAPLLWKRAETFTPERDYRIEHDLGNDYWLYERYAALAAKRYDTLVIGDSVVWGEYVKPEETLSHYLNEQAGQERFANLGLPGAHPLALAGLMEHYAGSIKDMNVVLHCDSLWLNSPRADLQDDKVVNEFSHLRLVPQFVPRIPSYKEKVSPRIGILVEQRLPYTSWSAHLQQAYYEQKSIPEWTLAHPYDDPFQRPTRGLPPLDHSLRHLPDPEPKDWKTSGRTPADFPWIDLETSLQWHAFQRTVEVLQRRGNRVFVLVGPFNELMLEPASLERYQKVKCTITAWLEEKQVPYIAPPPLPSVQYADASHPLAPGYKAVAEILWKELSGQFVRKNTSASGSRRR